MYPTLHNSSDTETGANVYLAQFQPCAQQQSMQTSQRALNTQVTIKDLAEFLTISKKGPLPE